LALFVTFEGGEGCGKSTQARALYKRVSESGIPVVLSHEPGGTSLGKKARHYLKQTRDSKISPLTELFLFAASRAQLVAEVICPSLERGTMVICDRYADSTMAYQGYGRGLDLDVIQTVNTMVTQGLLPDLVILLDLPVEIGLARKRSAQKDRFEREELAFHHRVREGYLKMAAADPQRWLVVDATLPKKRVAQIIWERVKRLL
jgi:dTMP kinase